MEILSLFETNGIWSWATLAAILLVAELLTGTTYLLWFGISAAIMAFITYLFPNTPISVDFLIFAILSIFNVMAGRKFFPANMSAKDNNLNDPDNRLIGQNVIAIDNFQSGSGFVKFGDTQWRAISANYDAKLGEKLIVKSVDGATLFVETYSELPKE